MLSLTKQKLTQVLNGKSTDELPELLFRGVEFDSRMVSADALFVALPGEKVHGHAFLESAVKKGAALCLVEDPSLLISSPEKDRLVAVADSLKALQELGRYARKQFSGSVLGVTGTIGKTTTRNFLSSILRQCGTANASIKSFNNHIGVPYTICNADAKASFTVLEMGMNHPGELNLLTDIAKPDVAIVTTVTPVHMEFFKDLDAVADAKCEIFNGVDANGVVLICGDNQELKKAAQRWKSVHTGFKGKFLSFGYDAHNDYAITKISDLLTKGFTVELRCPNQEFTLSIPMIGSYNAANIAAAVAMALQVCPDITLDQIQAALNTIKPEAHRLNLLKLVDGREILDDCYNASPTALISAISLLSKTKEQSKKVGVVIGGMFEMGEKTEYYHNLVGQEILKLSPEFCLIVGEVGKLFLKPLEEAAFPVKWGEKPLDMLELLLGYDFDLTLVKGSRGVRLEMLIEKLPLADSKG